jgi:hypothetical protein
MPGVFRPRFSHLVVETNAGYLRFSPPISSKEVADYIGISVESFISKVAENPNATRGELEFLIYSPTTQITNRVRVYYERKVSDEVRRQSPGDGQSEQLHEDSTGS